MFSRVRMLPQVAVLTMGTMVGLFLSGCAGDKASSFSILSAQATYKQSSTFAPRKVDILWVIDNSGSMASSQTNLANNFPSFIQGFQTKNYDFHMAITTTDAYMSYNTGDMTRSKYKGVIMDNNTPNLSSTFTNTVKVGTTGSGDERAFESFRAFLGNSLNSSFLRPGSFLAVIVVSDEDDFSHNDYSNGMSSYFMTEDYNNSSLYTVNYVKTFLDGYTNSTATVKNYSVSNISITNQTCLNQLNSGAQKIGTRYSALTTATAGYQGSLCASFSQVLAGISDSVLSGSSEFILDRLPIPESIQVIVNGASIPQDANNGWTYNATANSVSFHGSAIPSEGSNIVINYDPAEVKI